ncbi:MAG: DUF177 domain-containing protein [Desulfotomaculaceae bacterium]|nr:DUF177 domain-containing protein [Desulfotomaculaceae bacterium]
MLRLDVEILKKIPSDFIRFELLEELPSFELHGEILHFPSPVKASLLVSKNGPTIIVEGSVSGRIKLICDRCLEPFDFFFEAPVKECYAHTPNNSESEFVSYSGDVIDITSDVINDIILSLPMKSICGEECRGLCAKCGCNLNKGHCNCKNDDIDPRLSVLQTFVRKMNPEH